MPAPARATRFYLDFETTDLDVHECALLEVAAVAVNDELQELDRYHTLIRPASNMLARLAAEPYVQQLHESSGLLEALNSIDPQTLPTLEEVETYLIDLIDRYAGAGATVTLGGSGTERFDRRIIEARMPTLAARLTYWCEDLSGVRRMYAHTTGQDILGSATPARQHRALADAVEDVEVARRFRNLFLAERPRANSPRDNVLDALALIEAYTAHNPDGSAERPRTAQDIALLLGASDPRSLIFGLLDVAASVTSRTAAAERVSVTDILAGYRQSVLTNQP